MTAPELTDITVALIDDHDVVHEGLASWCAGATPPIAVAGRYLRPTEFLRDRAGGQGVRIDAVVLDLQFGDGSPLPPWTWWALSPTPGTGSSSTPCAVTRRRSWIASTTAR